ncbi:unnamed protein product [Lactuca virosa]|uniref:Uncharacterized protein n=1 Tax=Lactuca virosa TaxID=75947 RepID=A0AAU9NMY2_9ASTR|nr:unnamed protein product [Lactuca virosa]
MCFIIYEKNHDLFVSGRLKQFYSLQHPRISVAATWLYGRCQNTSPTMEKGSENSGSSESKSMENVPYLGTILTLPIETTVGKGSFENKTRVAFSDKQTGSYGRATATEKVIGDKSGYTEVYNEQRVRNVSFNNNNDNKNNDNKNVIAYDHGYGDEHGGYGYDSDSDNGDGVEYGGYVYYSDSDSDY